MFGELRRMNVRQVKKKNHYIQREKEEKIARAFF